MLDFSRQGLLDLTLDLVRIPSVSGTSHEERMAERIHELLAAESYFIKHPKHLVRIPTESDGLKRSAVLAFVASDTPSKRTLLLTGHHDVVDATVYGELSELAFDPMGYTAKKALQELAPDVRCDMDSGNYLFGRGTMDMKAGLAMHMAYLAQRARHKKDMADQHGLTPRPLNINLLFLSVPDEEADSVGMRGVLPSLVGFIEQHNLELVAAFTGEPAFWSSGPNPARTYYTGTTGKIMPVFYCLGLEAHVGYAFDGINASSLAAQVALLMEGNTDFMESHGNDALCPPVCLHLADRPRPYSVTLAERAAAYFNVLTTTRTPDEMLHACSDVAKKAMTLCLDRWKKAGAAYGQATGQKNPVPSWPVHVITYSSVYEMAVKELGAEVVEKRLSEHLQTLPKNSDQREQSLALMDCLISLAHLKGPAIIVGFVPPYYPPRINTRASAAERTLLNIMQTITAKADASCGQVKLVECFGGITDLSFLGFQGEAKALHSLAKNMPGWGFVYDLPMESLMQLDVPIANMGPSGKDAHKDVERLELDYSFELAPRLLDEAVTMLEADPLLDMKSAP